MGRGATAREKYHLKSEDIGRFTLIRCGVTSTPLPPYYLCTLGGYMKLFSLALSLLLLTSCGNSNVGNSIGAARGVIKSNGNTVGYILNLETGGLLTAYISSVDRYVTINPVTGAYAATGTMYFTTAGCAGTPYVNAGWKGMVGKTVLFDGSKYYLVSSMVTSPTTISSNATATSGTSSYMLCTNSSASIQLNYGAASLTETTQPYDFASVAPLTVDYP